MAEENAAVIVRKACFQLKANFSPCMIMHLSRFDLADIEKQLSTTVNRAPSFFVGSPVVIDLEAIKAMGSIDFQALKEIINASNMVPIGVRGGSQEQHNKALQAGIPVISIGRAMSADSMAENLQKQPEKSETLTRPENHETARVTKLITTPVRSGMQIYAKDADLIVTAPVSHGAELLADGHIHVYGPLRGRALAGVQGNTEARIFCRTLEAELVAIAGYYLVQEEMQPLPQQGAAVQVYLENEDVKIDIL